MSNKLSSTPQWKWLMQQQRGMDIPRRRETYYTGESFTVPKEQFEDRDGQMVSTGNYPDEMRGKSWKVVGVGEPPNPPLLMAMSHQKMLHQKLNNERNVDPGPKERIDDSGWKSGHWKVAKIMLRRDMDRADIDWMRTGSKRAYRQYKLLQTFIETKSQQNFDADDSFSTKYLHAYRKAYSDSSNTRNTWDVRGPAFDFITDVREKLGIPTYNKL